MIVVFGSLNIDMVMKVEKMPQPGDTALSPSYQIIPGGKGANQAIAAAKAGGSVKLFGKIGDDAFGRLVLESLEKTNVDTTGVGIKKNMSTGCATVCVDTQGENMIIAAGESNLQAREAEIPDFLVSKNTTLLLQMETPLEENWKLIRRAKKYGARIILNLAPAQNIPQDILESLDILVMNQIEAAHLALYLGFNVISPTVAARRLTANYGVTCIVTLGKEGALLCSPKGTWEVKALEIEAVDTTAAGDAFVGVLAASLDSGMDLLLSLRRASVASSLACLTSGAQSSLPSPLQIEANLQKIPLPKQIA